MDDVYGYSAVLISRDILDCEGCPVLSVESKNSVSSLLDQLGASAVLLRPDRYVLATAKDANKLKNCVILHLIPLEVALMSMIMFISAHFNKDHSK